LLKSGEPRLRATSRHRDRLHLNVLGDIAFEIDGKPLDFSESFMWRHDVYGIPEHGLGLRLFSSASWTAAHAIWWADSVCRFASAT